MRYIFGTTDYLGAGSDIIAKSFVTSCAWYVFILKMLFTAVTLGGGFKGGELFLLFSWVQRLEAS